jgi:hypothetical protein
MGPKFERVGACYRDAIDRDGERFDVAAAVREYRELPAHGLGVAGRQ